ncbi:MAG: NapC/NirT family cytochrome c [Myxococcales bacterium]
MRTRLFILLAAMLAVALAWTAQNFRTRIASDPAFCANCHEASPELALWSKTAHARLACQKCHHTSTEQGVTMLAKFMLAGPPRAGEHAKVRIGDCAGCHLSHDRIWGDISASRGHRVHAVEKKIACIRCHGNDAHRVEPQVESCRECHGEHAVKLEGMQKLHCFACHDFLSVDADLKPSRRDCLRCHRERGLDTAAFAEGAPMRFVCSECHKPHQARALVECRSCHQEVAQAGLHRRPGHGDCRGCHHPHSWTSGIGDCLRCHRTAGTHADSASCASCHSFRGVPASAGRLPGK